MILLDTGVLIGAKPPLGPGDPTGVTALSLAELEFGLSVASARSDAGELRRRATRLARIRSVYGEGTPFDGAAAIAYGTVSAAVLAAGRSPRARTVDLLIAAIAVSRGAALLTTQPGEFRGLEHLLDVRGA